MRILTGAHNTGGANVFSYLTKDEKVRKWDKRRRKRRGMSGGRKKVIRKKRSRTSLV